MSPKREQVAEGGRKPERVAHWLVVGIELCGCYQLGVHLREKEPTLG